MKIGLGQRFAGLIDELLILDVALSAAQVHALHRLHGPAGGLLQTPP